ncbi:MAG: triple tyrosine motif-containing protein, partial [Acidobacteriota bacterium]|nr:triple tyrosine motif-containing protein [Acidobacteriota bacterium]
GTMTYQSLADKVPHDARGFTDVWRTWATKAGVLFQTEQAVYRWANDTITVIRPPTRLNRSSLVDGQMYVTLPESGLNVLEGDTFRPLPGTEMLGSEVYPIIYRYDEKRLLIGTRFNGFFLYDGAVLTRFQTELDEFLKSASLYKGIVLADGTFVMATTNAGMVMMDRQGRRVMVIDRTQGLPANAIYNVMADREGAIWTTGERGMGRVEFPSPATAFGEADGFNGSWTPARFMGRLFLAWQSGVSYLAPPSAGQPARFIRIPGIGQQSWAFAEMTDPTGKVPTVLAVASTDGLYEIQGTTAAPIHAPRDGTFRAASLERSRRDPSRLWIVLFDGLSSYRWVNGRWIDEGRVPGVTEQLRSLVEDDDGNLWAGTNAVGLVRLTFATPATPGTPRPTPTITRYGEKDGLPQRGVGVLRIHGKVYFLPWSAAADNIVATWDAKAQKFVKDEFISGLPSDKMRGSFGLAEGPNGTLLANAGKGTRVLTPDGKGGWTADEALFSRFGQVPTGYVFVEPGDIAWFGYKEQYVRFDMKRAAAPSTAFKVLVRRVTAGDTVLYGGGTVATAPRLPASTDALRLEFAGPTFIDETATQYQTKLDGLDPDWTNWTDEARRDFTNLSFGDYRFHVRARSVTGAMGEEAIYAFTILPPWYRTWWAYGGYVLLLGLVGFGIDRIQRRRLLGKERQRSEFAQARLRAESAEALARSEADRNRNIELLSEIGRDITASLD